MQTYLQQQQREHFEMGRCLSAASLLLSLRNFIKILASPRQCCCLVDRYISQSWYFDMGIWVCVFVYSMRHVRFLFLFLLFACHWFSLTACLVDSLRVSPSYCLFLLFVRWFTLLSWVLLSAHPFLTHPPVIAWFFHRLIITPTPGTKTTTNTQILK